MKKLCEDLKAQFDYVLLDCPAGIEQGFKNAIAGAAKAIVVTTPEVSAIRDADRIIGLLEANDLRDISLIINRVRIDMVKRGEMMSVEDVVDILAVKLLGVLPDDEQVVISTNQGEPVTGSRSLAGTAFSNISRRITGEEIPIMELKSKKEVLDIYFVNKEGFRYVFLSSQQQKLKPYCQGPLKAAFSIGTVGLFSADNGYG